MQLFVNDLSIHGQFRDLSAFRDALGRIMAIRRTAKLYGRELHCHGSFSGMPVTSDGILLKQAVPRVLAKDEQRAVMQWLDRSGPFWDVEREHDENDYFECKGDVVTDTAIGEAAYRNLHGARCDLVSAVPSEWDFSPIEVVWNREAEGLESKTAILENWRNADSLEKKLRDTAPPLQSWGDLQKASESRFENLTFTQDCFKPLEGRPFADSTANRCIELLGILDRFACAFDLEGKRTPEGNDIYQNFFTGERAWFSDSTSNEKNDFLAEMTFRHPDNPEKSLFCPRHGKVNYRHFPIRIHFSWPVLATEPLYVAYVGPKITQYH